MASSIEGISRKSTGSTSESDSESDSVIIIDPDAKPTEVTDSYWIYARNQTEKNQKQPNDNCGKWLIFEPPSKIDEVWGRIRSETEEGRLGFASKVATKKSKNESASVHGVNYVICVYTYDSTDEADAMRVRDRLRDLGFHKKLPYKTDAATYAGAYRHTTGGRVSKWYI